MFERRLKIFLSILLVVTGAMLLRAVQLQVFGRDDWQRQAVESMKRPQLIETTRGRILDAKNKVIALDEACIDATVDFRAIVYPPDPDWVRGQAIARVRRDLGTSYWKVPADARKERIARRMLAVEEDVKGMWQALADELVWQQRGSAGAVSSAERAAAMEKIDETRRAIVERVQMRRRYVWYQKYRKAVADQDGQAAPWYFKWVLGDPAEDGPDVDHFMEDVGEQEAPHPILRRIDSEARIRLQKNRSKYPGLDFLPGAERLYPYDNVASHVLGRLSKVMREDIQRDPNLGRNELREYQTNDMIGRMGLEALCEPTLRGTRGQVVRVAGETTEISKADSIPGADVQTSLDIELQRDVEQLFTKVKLKQSDGTETTQEMHGAAVVIDVATGAVRALASWPTYDANRFDSLYGELSTDDINKPLVNRATQWAIEPGSTVKPIVGLGAITDGLCSPLEGIECTGYVMIGGNKSDTHRCWTAKMYARSRPDTFAHHQLPPAPHKGRDGNLDGFLTFADALERSCNVYFVNLAHELGTAGLSKWFRAFGLGRLTGVGIAESRGSVPTSLGMSGRHVLGDTWSAGIGQGQVSATTIQMANVAATVARDGIWVRPHLVDPKVATSRAAGAAPLDGPDRVDLRLSHAAILAAKRGMYDVVYSNGGTATFQAIVREDVRVAGKTGSAQTGLLSTPVRDARGNIVYECAKCQSPAASVQDQKQWQCPKPGCSHDRRRTRRVIHQPRSPQNPDGPIPWYRAFGENGTDISHAWFIGYAPAENPQIAFAVMVEYGGSGGYAAGGVANGVIDACLQHGYLQAKPRIAGVPQ